ncbi:hypothetical protein GLOTRDRAFT_115984 [Gloeophyllum trabeum ATCC 11539]|uniref:P-loop containing nucleoside triphosphate hydrolase protein n=1 Tax=Gloeophyllum trabeum (strain ATCC 11539 / FP-39264 / Madison 617) TaxID=670483 RepID=S7RRW3_GLOTA|nr:uncharacterized protein GLOTRDRAFT_115984 [Gloeophyllum trabeum ATCC 11539]EPQ55744.1 hypothetical protein GLOTRDRAFT_115984 [Gloeophyllum trabeum ATCC 11539]
MSRALTPPTPNSHESLATPASQATPPCDDSVTESESETEPDEPAAEPPSKIFDRPSVTNTRVAATADEDSVTESDSDDPSQLASSIEVRPNFPLLPGQQRQGPFVLDAKSHVKVPASINTYLRDYQRDGANFFYDHYKQGSGGLLGDDMGLVISFLSAVMKKHGDSRDIGRRREYVSLLQDLPDWKERRQLPAANQVWPTCLVIAPSSVVGNWEREFETWGYFEVGLYIGPQRKRVLNDFKMGRLDVVITSRTTAAKDIELLNYLPWSIIIVDEVHYLKNPRSKTTESYHTLTPSAVRFGLTGTAIQNSYTELWTILDWCVPGCVGTPRQWKGYVTRPLLLGQSASANDEEKIQAQVLLLLPRKTDEVVFCPLASKQIEVYKRLLASDDVKNMIRKDEWCDCGSRLKRKDCCYPWDKSVLFKYMSALIKISNHLALILPAPKDTAEQTARNRELTDLAFANEPQPSYGQASLEPRFCGKWLKFLAEWRRDPSNKVLIFTKSVKLLNILDFHLRKEHYKLERLDGSMNQADRMPAVDRFNNDPFVNIFLISTMAGGTGLNLTSANKVVIFDPAHDLQAMDRAYRFGQTRDVAVYRLLGAGSIEELIYARQIYKQQQMKIGYEASVQTRYFEGVQNDKARQGELFGLENIFKLQEDSLATKMAIEKADLANLAWALQNMEGKSKKRRKSEKGGKASASQQEYDADVCCTFWDHCSESSHCPRRLMSVDWTTFYSMTVSRYRHEIHKRAHHHSLALPQSAKKDEVQKALKDYGVKYTHLNDDILKPNRIEEQRIQAAAKRKSKKKDPHEDDSWFTKLKRHQHKAPPRHESRLRSRQEALIELGMVRNPAEIATFAKEL